MNTAPACYVRRLPVLASWSLQSECNTVIFFQVEGNAVRVIGSRSFPLFTPLNTAFSAVKVAFPWKHCEVHILPADTADSVVEIFEDAGFDTETAPEVTPLAVLIQTRELFSVLTIDQEPRDWEEEGEENNTRLIDSLNGYRSEPIKRQPDTYSAHPVRSWEVYLVRAFEAFAVWWHAGGATGWGRAPNNTAYNAGVI